MQSLVFLNYFFKRYRRNIFGRRGGGGPTRLPPPLVKEGLILSAFIYVIICRYVVLLGFKTFSQ